jgi:hypothetical protein
VTPTASATSAPDASAAETQTAVDPAVSTAFFVGWQVAALYRDGSLQKPEGRGGRDGLPGLSALSPFERTTLTANQVEAGLERLADRLAVAGVDPVSIRDLRKALDADADEPDKFRRPVEQLHVDVLLALTAADPSLGKAYGLGHALADTCLLPEDRDLFDQAFGPRIVNIKDWLADLASRFPPHSSRAVVVSLRAWESWAADPKIDEGALDWPKQGAGVRAALRRQGELWRALLSGEKQGRDMLRTTDYLQAARGLIGQTMVMARRFLGRLAIPLALAILSLGGGIALLVTTGAGGKVVGALLTAAGAIGITSAGIRARLSQVAMQLEARLWGAELDLAIAGAVLIGPDGWGKSVADDEIDVPATGASPKVTANLDTLAQFRAAVKAGDRIKVAELLAPGAEFTGYHQEVTEGDALADWVVQGRQQKRIATEPQRVVAAVPGKLVAYIDPGADVWRLRESKILHWQSFADRNTARQLAGLRPVLELSPDEASAHLQRYRPYLRYDSRESYFADSVATMTNFSLPGTGGNTLKRADGTVLASTDPGQAPATLNLDFLDGSEYESGEEVRHDDYLDATGRDYVLDARRMHAVPAYADRVYGHAVVDNEGRQWLQYWCFYYYNDKSFVGVGLHEGDWEMVQIGLDADGEPELVTVSQHKGGQRCAWSDLEQHGSRGGRGPVIYVALGSHANHIAAGKYEAPVVPDYCDAGGALIRPAVEQIDDSGPPWALWPGSWGSTRARSKLESDSPRGPHTKDPWRNPGEFHAKALPSSEVRARAEQVRAQRGPPAPILSARREGDQAVIEYSFPPLERDQPAPAQVVLTVDSPDDTLPAASYSVEVSGDRGAEEHPLPLEDKRYEIQATAYSEDGQASQAASVSL